MSRFVWRLRRGRAAWLLFFEGRYYSLRAVARRDAWYAQKAKERDHILKVLS